MKNNAFQLKLEQYGYNLEYNHETKNLGDRWLAKHGAQYYIQLSTQPKIKATTIHWKKEISHVP